MQIIQQITWEWKRWIDDNLARGCSNASIVESMIAAGMDPEVSRKWLVGVKANSGGVISPDPVVPAPAASGPYRYEKARMALTGNVTKTYDRDVRVTMRADQPVGAIF